MEKTSGPMLIMLIVGIVIGAGITYCMQPQNNNYQGTAQQLNINQQNTGIAPDITCEWDNDEFDHSATVDVEGNVDTDTEIKNKLTILNEGETDINNIWISFYNPVNDNYGLDEELEIDAVKVTITRGNIKNMPLFNDDEYTYGHEIYTIPSGSELEIDFSFWLLKCDNNEFNNGETFDCEVYIYGAGAPSVERCKFTVVT